MTQPSPRPLHERLTDHDLIKGAIDRAVREALLTHARLGNPVATWRDGKVVWLQPAEVFALLGEQEPVKP
jgi:hypothetical protein